MILVRIYGLCTNSRGELLITHERYGKNRMTKFPGGGLEYGEGTRDCLVREFREELDMEIRVTDHFYTTDFFQPSAYHQRAQVLSIYYRVEILDEQQPLIPKDKNLLAAEFIRPEDLHEQMFTLPIDKIVAKMWMEQQLPKK